MQLFQLHRKRSQHDEAKRQQAVKRIHRLYLERVSMPRKLRRYETKLALMKVAGYSEDRALETIDRWNTVLQQRKQQKLRQKKVPNQSTVASAIKQIRPAISPLSTGSTATFNTPLHEPDTQIRRVHRAVQEEADALLNLPLEDKLRSAELISQHQLEIARMEQFTARDGRTTATIFEDKGWVKPETIHFFETTLLQASFRKRGMPLWYYLQIAGLLTKAQVEELHQDREVSGVSFEKAAELRGWVKRNTIYFLNACLNI